MSILLATPSTVKHVAVTSPRVFQPKYEMAMPSTTDTPSASSSPRVHTTAGSRAGSAVATPKSAIGRIDSPLTYRFGPHEEAHSRCGPTMCLPYAMSSEMMRQ